mmetsp:Transcript_93331/g.259431  ORF Transcript_93331/g.259431 Transcript_93331/m.259431 type:complete len:209 (-) Transcript_93331:565-1191(-)
MPVGAALRVYATTAAPDLGCSSLGGSGASETSPMGAGGACKASRCGGGPKASGPNASGGGRAAFPALAAFASAFAARSASFFDSWRFTGLAGGVGSCESIALTSVASPKRLGHMSLGRNVRKGHMANSRTQMIDPAKTWSKPNQSSRLASNFAKSASVSALPPFFRQTIALCPRVGGETCSMATAGGSVPSWKAHGRPSFGALVRTVP